MKNSHLSEIIDSSRSEDGKYGNLSRSHSITILAVVFLLIIYGLVVCQPIPNLQSNRGSVSDLNYYKAVVTRVHNGESYYSAAAYELRNMGYNSRSVFNWRLPFLAWFLSILPSPKIAQGIAFIVGGSALFLWLRVFRRGNYGSAQMILGGLLLAGPLVYSIIPGPCLMHEYWAGILIFFSLALYSAEWRYSSVLFGLTALFVRELALPFVAGMLILAVYEKKWREGMLWLSGIVVYAAIFLLHWSTVAKLIKENDRALAGGWIAFGGWPFALNTAQMHPLFVLAPAWLAATVVPLCLLGLWGQKCAWGVRVAATVSIYMLMFSIVGRSFNAYWGLLYSFLPPIGLIVAPCVLLRLWRRSRQVPVD